MESSDPYDPIVAFDDYYGIVTGAGRARDLADTARGIVRRARASQLRAPVRVEVVGDDSTDSTFEAGGINYTVGDGDDGVELPVFDELHRCFAAALPAPKLVRVDTPESYDDFRARRRAPYLQALEARVAALEAALAAHVADHLIDSRGEAALVACGAATHGGEAVWLPLPDWAEGKIDCWRDGQEILCTVRLPGPDGRARMATSATQLNGCIEEVVGHADAEGADEEELLAIGPPLAQVIGGARLVHQLCGAAPELLARAARGPFVGVLTSADPAIAAAMMLFQRCQLGDRQACADAAALASAHRALFEDARERLERAQSERRAS